MTTDRDISKELIFSHDIDMENGNDMNTICYQSLFGLFTELVDRIEQLEKRLDQQEEYQEQQND